MLFVDLCFIIFLQVCVLNNYYLSAHVCFLNFVCVPHFLQLVCLRFEIKIVIPQNKLYVCWFFFLLYVHIKYKHSDRGLKNYRIFKPDTLSQFIQYTYEKRNNNRKKSFYLHCFVFIYIFFAYKFTVYIKLLTIKNA